MKFLLLLLPLTLLAPLLRLELGIGAETTEIAPASPPNVEASTKLNAAESKKKTAPAPASKSPAKVSSRIPRNHTLLFM
jgi:hypothetical protein